MKQDYDYRGKCVSTHGKVTKDGKPKRSGNFSYQTFHQQSLQYKDYRVTLRTDENGKQQLIVGDHTPLSQLMPAGLVEMALTDQFLDSCVRTGTIPYRGKNYECSKRLTRYKASGYFAFEDLRFIYREEIYTDGDFKYNFTEY